LERYQGFEYESSADERECEARKTNLPGGTMKKVVLQTCSLLIALLAFAFLATAEDLTLPEGTSLKVKLENTITTSTNQAGDPFSGRVMEAVNFGGKAVIPVGTEVQGRLTKVTDPRRISGRPTIGIFPEALILPNGDRVTLNATLVDTSIKNGTDVNSEGQFKGKGHDTRDMTEIGIGTGVGLLSGGLFGGGKGMLVGGAIGATATVAHWLSKHNTTVLPSGTELFMELSRPLVMTSATAAPEPAPAASPATPTTVVEPAGAGQ
jgi:hypothetical protein